MAPLAIALLSSALALYAVAAHAFMFRLLTVLHYNDFGKFYYAAGQWSTARTFYGPSAATAMPFGDGRIEQFLNLNPPHFHALIWPLLSLPIDQAYVVWAAVNLLAGIAAVTAIVRVVRVPPAVTLTLLAGASASAPVLAWAATGQITGILMAAVTFAWLALRNRRWNAAAVAIGIVCSVKVFLAPLAVYLVIKRQWKAACLSALAALLPFVLGLLVFGVDTHEEWLQALADVRWTGAVMNASLSGLLGRTWSLDAFVLAPALDVVGAILSLILVIVGCLYAWRTDDVDAAVLMLLVTSLLASPLGWVYYVPVIAGPLTAMLAAGRLSRWVYVPLGALMVPFPALYPYPSRFFAVTAGSLYAWSLIGIWAATSLRAMASSDRRASTMPAHVSEGRTT